MPVRAFDPFGLELQTAPPEEFGPITLDVIDEEGEYELGVLKTNFHWEDDGEWIFGFTWIPVPSSICSECRFYFGSCTIKRRARGFTRIETTKVVPSGEYPANLFAGLIAELNMQVLLEETLHQEATHRWIRDHQQTGLGTGCSEPDAAIAAGQSALRKVRVYEIRAVQALNAENAMIDFLMDLWQSDIIMRIDQLKASMN